MYVYIHVCKGEVKIRDYEILLFCFKALLASKNQGL